MRLAYITTMLMVFILSSFRGEAQEAKEGIRFCAEYVAQKTMGFIADSEVVGKSCSGTYWLKKVSGGKFTISAVVPVASFESGSRKRDSDIEKLLTSPSSKGLLQFESQELDSHFLEQLKAGKTQLPGTLTLKDTSRDVRFDVQLQTDKKRIQATTNASLRDYNLEPPRVLGGFIAKVHPDFTMRVYLDAEILTSFQPSF